eukprot:Seg1715.4 transcript_id=Seg1715.4/GoldUCD/mRNA.D3Y31 product=Neuroglobin protein_id=Seg1715.4/GoldUCD/D3Y31
MGCTASLEVPGSSKKHVSIKTTFPLSMYQKLLLEDTWVELEKNILQLGNGMFYRLFQLRPDLQSVFPEFGYIEDIEDIKKSPILSGHPRKLTFTVKEAVNCLNDADLFITKLEALGEKHVENNLKPDYLNALGIAFVGQIEECLGNQCTNDVKRAWADFYNFICKLMKQGLARRLATVNSESA